MLTNQAMVFPGVSQPKSGRTVRVPSGVAARSSSAPPAVIRQEMAGQHRETSTLTGLHPEHLKPVLASHLFKAVDLANPGNLPSRPECFKSITHNALHRLDGRCQEFAWIKL